MTLDTSRPGSGPERLTAHEARHRLDHERSSRLSQLHALEEAETEIKDSLLAAQKESVRHVLKEIDAAFARVRDGSYGTCRECGTAIPAERLEILPYVPCCVGCTGAT